MLAGGVWRRYYLFLLLVLSSSLARPASCEDSIDGSGSETGDFNRNESTGDTLSDDEDFTGKIPVTFYATSVLSCSSWKEVDRIGSSETIINKMLVYVDSVCECGFDNRYLTSIKTKCNTHAGTLLVSTNMSLPFNHQRSQLINHLENWLQTEPSFTKTINGGRTLVSVVDLEITHTTYPSPPALPGSGDPTDPPVTATTEVTTDSNVESGSGSGDDDNFESSSPVVTVNFGTILLTCAAVLILSLL